MSDSVHMVAQRDLFATSFVRNFVAGILPRRHVEQTRLWEVDACRALALGMMLVYHFAWNLEDLAGYELSVHSGFWSYWQMATAGLFTFLAGVSLSLSRTRGGGRPTYPSVSTGWARQLGRGAALLAWAMVISLVTYLVFGPERYVRFGILHLIGVSAVLAYPLARYRWLNLALGLAVLGLGIYLDTLDREGPWLVWLVPVMGAGVDQAPLLPMLGPILLGLFLGNLLFPGGRRRLDLPAWETARLLQVARYLGQNTLLVYLWHQPVFVGLFLLAGVAEWPLGSQG